MSTTMHLLSALHILEGHTPIITTLQTTNDYPSIKIEHIKAEWSPTSHDAKLLFTKETFKIDPQGKKDNKTLLSFQRSCSPHSPISIFSFKKINQTERIYGATTKQKKSAFHRPRLHNIASNQDWKSKSRLRNSIYIKKKNKDKHVL